MTQTSAGYGAIARLYREAGWSAVLPLPSGQKTPPPDGFTGREGADPDEARIAAWSARHPKGNVALRMPDGVAALDTDAYGEKKGGITLATAEGQWGPLPPTWRSTSRPDDPVSGIRFFRVPAGTVLPGQLEAGANGTRTGDIEIVQRHHRYAVVWPSLHPERRRYVWFRPDGSLAAEGEVPRPEDLPELPQTWLSGLLVQGRGGDPRALLDALAAGDPCVKMQEFRERALGACQGPSRHDNVSRLLLAIVRLGERGHPGAQVVLDELRAAFCEAVAKVRPRGAQEASQEFDRMLVGGAEIVAGSRTRQSERGCFCGEVPDKGMTDAHLTDVVTMDVLRGRWLWSGALGWLRWDDRRWVPAPAPVLQDEVRKYLLSRHKEAEKTAHELAVRIEKLAAHRGLAKATGNGSSAAATQELEELAQRQADAEQEAKQWQATLSNARIVAISNLTRGVVVCDTAEFDSRPDLLNVANGVIDLRTGTLMPHEPDLLLTKLAPVPYRPQAVHPDWGKALTAVPDDARDWYQERLGQAITGHIPPDDVLVVQKGTGENGKTTLMSGVQAVLGDYFLLASERVLLADPTAHPTELMDLRGARVALIEETPEERRLSVNRLKKVVGNPTITARRIRQDPVTFAATHALFVSTNYLPIVEETDHGTWRRLACLCFPYMFRKPGQALSRPDDRPGDPGLRQRLKEGHEGQHEAILAWVVEGARRWYANGCRMSPPPDRIVNDTRGWQRYSDLFLAYVDEHLVYDPDRHVMCRELFTHFNAWLTERRHSPWGDRTFYKRIEEHHETSAHQVVRKVLRRDQIKVSRPPGALETDLPKQYHAWLGIRFRTDADPAGGGLPPGPPDGNGVMARGTGQKANPEDPSQLSQPPPPSPPTHPSMPSQPSHPSRTNGALTAEAGAQVIEATRHNRHNPPPANSRAAGVTAVTPFLVNAANDSASRAHEETQPTMPSQPSQDCWTARADASGPTEPPAPSCLHSSVALGSGLIRCLNCGATRSPGRPWPGEQPDAAHGGEEVSHDAV
jgi:putative DNA primase/helicase